MGKAVEHRLPMMRRLENEIVGEAMRQNGGRATSQQVFDTLTAMAREALAKGQVTRRLAASISLAITLNPYVPQTPALIDLHHQILKAIYEQKMPELAHIARQCTERKMPMPIIVSCEKYLDKARNLQASLRDDFFGVTPVIVRGDPALDEERYEEPVLTLPVADTYETLPAKIAELCLLLRVLSPGCGFLKIDDDLLSVPGRVRDTGQAAGIFATADYIGVPIHNIFHDRIWHFGKCAAPVPAVYGKPIKSVWARGALYFLSARALDKLTGHYLRFPGCLEGELYEDKAIGDILHECGIVLMQYPLEKLVGLNSRLAGI
jgi:hypothetical protein